MHTPRVRTSRTIRARLAKRKGVRTIRKLTIDRHGLIIDGDRFPHYIGTDIDIEHLGPVALVTVGLFADSVDVRPPLGRRARISQRWA